MDAYTHRHPIDVVVVGSVTQWPKQCIFVYRCTSSPQASVHGVGVVVDVVVVVVVVVVGCRCVGRRCIEAA